MFSVMFAMMFTAVFTVMLTRMLVSPWPVLAVFLPVIMSMTWISINLPVELYARVKNVIEAYGQSGTGVMMAMSRLGGASCGQQDSGHQY